MPGILRLRSLSQTFLSQTLASTLLLSSRPLRASLACLVSIVSLSQVRTRPTHLQTCLPRLLLSPFRPI